MSFNYRIVTEWSQEDEAWIAKVPALPGCMAHGNTVEVATQQAITAAEAILEVMVKDGRPIPKADATHEYSGRFNLRLPKSLHKRLDEIAQEEDCSLNQVVVDFIAAQVARREAEIQREAGMSPTTAAWKEKLQLQKAAEELLRKLKGPEDAPKPKEPAQRRRAAENERET